MVNNVENKCDCKCIHIDRLNIAKNVLEDCIDIESLAEFYKNFADETRLKILKILDCVECMCVCDIAVAWNMTKSAISHQLKYLKDCNLLKSKREGKIVFYSLKDEHVREIIECGITHLKEKCDEKRI